jgi:hypothetical protein
MAGSSDRNETALDFQRALANLKPLGFRNPLLPPMPPLGSSWMQFPLWVLFKQYASEAELEEFRNIFDFWNFGGGDENSLNGLPFSIPWSTETESSVELGAASNVPLGNFEVESLGSEPLALIEPDADSSNLAEAKLSERNEFPENQNGDRSTSNADPVTAQRDPDLAPLGLDGAASSPEPDIDESYPQSYTVPEVAPIGVENSGLNASAHNAPLGFWGVETPSRQLPEDSSAVEVDAEFIASDSSTSEFSAPLSEEDRPSTAEHLTPEHAEHFVGEVQEPQPSTPQKAPSERDLDIDGFSRADRTEALSTDRTVEQDANSVGDAQSVNSLTPFAETTLPGESRQSGPESVDTNHRPLTSPPELLQEASETNASLNLQPVENSHGLSSEDVDSDEIAFESTVPNQTILGDATSAEVTTDWLARLDIDPSKGEATQVDTLFAELQVAEPQVAEPQVIEPQPQEALPRKEDSQLNERATQRSILAQELWAEPHNLAPQSAQLEPRQLDASDPASAESSMENFSSSEISSVDTDEGLKSEQTDSSIAASDNYQQPIQEPSREFSAGVLEDLSKNTSSFEPTVVLNVSDTPTSSENTQIDAIADSSLPSIEPKSDSISLAGPSALEPNSEVADFSSTNATELTEASNESISQNAHSEDQPTELVLPHESASSEFIEVSNESTSQNTLPEDRPTELVLPHESASLSLVDPTAVPSEESARLVEFNLVEFNELDGLPTGDVSPISLTPQQDGNTADVKVENLEQTNLEHSDSFVGNEVDLNEVSGSREVAELAEAQLNAPAELPSSSDEEPFELLSPVTFLQEIDRAQTTSFFADRQSVSMPAEEQLNASSEESSTSTVSNPTVSVPEVPSQTIPIDASEPPGEFKDESQNTSQREPDQGQTQDAFDSDLESATSLAEIPSQAEPTKASSWLQRSVDWLKSRLGGSSDTAETIQVSTESSENTIDPDSENSGILPAPSSQVEASKVDRTLSPQADQVFEIPPATEPSSDISYAESDSNAPTSIDNDASTSRSIEDESQASSFEVERSVIWFEPPADKIQVSGTPVSEGSSEQQTEQTMPLSEMLHRPEIETEEYPSSGETTLESLLEIDGENALNLGNTSALSASGENAEFTLEDISVLPTPAHEAITSVDLEKIQDPEPALPHETEPLPDALANQSSRQTSEQLRPNIPPLAPSERPVLPNDSDMSRAEETALDLPSNSENDNVPISSNDSRANVNLSAEGVSERSEELSSQSDRQFSFGVNEKSQEINLGPSVDSSSSSLEQSTSIASQEQASGPVHDASADENFVHSEVEALESTQSQSQSQSLSNSQASTDATVAGQSQVSEPVEHTVLQVFSEGEDNGSVSTPANSSSELEHNPAVYNASLENIDSTVNAATSDPAVNSRLPSGSLDPNNLAQNSTSDFASATTDQTAANEDSDGLRALQKGDLESEVRNTRSDENSVRSFSSVPTDAPANERIEQSEGPIVSQVERASFLSNVEDERPDAHPDQLIDHSSPASKSEAPQVAQNQQGAEKSNSLVEESPTLLQAENQEGVMPLEDSETPYKTSLEFINPLESSSQELEADSFQSFDTLSDNGENIPSPVPQQEKPSQEFNTNSNLETTYSSESLPSTFLVTSDEVADRPASSFQADETNLQPISADIREQSAAPGEYISSEESENVLPLSSQPSEDSALRGTQSDTFAKQLLGENEPSVPPEQVTVNRESGSSQVGTQDSTQLQYLSDSEESPTVLQEFSSEATSRLENRDFVSGASAELSSPSENSSQELEGTFISQASDSVLEDRVNPPLSGLQQENPLQEFDTKSEMESRSADSLPATFLLIPDEAAALSSSPSQVEANSLQSPFANIQDEPAVSEGNVLSEASENISTRLAEDRSVHAVQSDALAEQVVNEGQTSALPEQATANAESDNAESDGSQIEERADALAVEENQSVEENQFSDFGERTILQASPESVVSGNKSTPSVNSDNDKSTQPGSSVETLGHIQSSSPQLDNPIGSSSLLGRDIDPTHRSATEDATQSAFNAELLRTPSDANLQSPIEETEAATIPSSSRNISENLVAQSSAEDTSETEAVQPFEQWPASGSPRTNRNLGEFNPPATFSAADSAVSAQTMSDDEQSRFLTEDQANAIASGHDQGHDRGSELFENTVLQGSPKENITDSTSAIAANLNESDLSESDLSEPSINVGFEPSLAEDPSSSAQEAHRTTQRPPAPSNSAEPEDREDAVQGENIFSAPAIDNEGLDGLDPLSPLQSSESENRFKHPVTSDAENTVLQAEPESVVPKVVISDSATPSATDRTSELESPQNLVESESSDSLNPLQKPDVSGDRFKRSANVEESTILQSSGSEAVVPNAITPDSIVPITTVPITTNRLDELNPQQDAPASQEIGNLVDVVDEDLEDRNHEPIIGLVDSTEQISASGEPIVQLSDNVVGDLLYQNDGTGLPEIDESLSASQRQDVDIVSEQFIPQVVSPSEFYPDSYRQPPEAIVSTPNKPNLGAKLPKSNEPESHGAQVSQEPQQHSYGQDGPSTPPPVAAPDSPFSDRFDSGSQSNRQSSDGDLSPEVNEVDSSQGEENTVLQTAPVSEALPDVDPISIDRTNIQSDSSIEQSNFTEPRGTVSASGSTNAISSNSAGSDLADSNVEAELESGVIAPETKANQANNDSPPNSAPLLSVPLNTPLGEDFSVSTTDVRSESISVNNTDARESRTESQPSGEVEVKGFQNEESTLLQASPVEESASDVNRANLQSGLPTDSPVQQHNLADPTASAYAPEALSSLPSQEPVDTQSVFAQQNNAIDSSVEGDSSNSDLGGMSERTATAFQDFGERDFDPSAQPIARSAEPVQPDNLNQASAQQNTFPQGEVSGPSGNAISDSNRSSLESQARPSSEPAFIEEQTSIQEKFVIVSENSSEVLTNFTSEQSDSVPESQSQPSSVAIEGVFYQDSQDVLEHSSDPSQPIQSSQSPGQINPTDRTQAASSPDSFTFVQDREPFQGEESTDRQIDVENNVENPDSVFFSSSNAASDAESVSSEDFKSTNSNSTNPTSPMEERTVLQQHESRSNSAADSVGETFSSEEVKYNRSISDETSAPASENQPLFDDLPQNPSFKSRLDSSTATESNLSSARDVSESVRDSETYASEHFSAEPVSFVERNVGSASQSLPSDDPQMSEDRKEPVVSSQSASAFVSELISEPIATVTEIQDSQPSEKRQIEVDSAIAEGQSVQPSEFLDSSLPIQSHDIDVDPPRNASLLRDSRSEFELPISNQPESSPNSFDELNDQSFGTTNNSSQPSSETYNQSLSNSGSIADGSRSPSPFSSAKASEPFQAEEITGLQVGAEVNAGAVDLDSFPSSFSSSNPASENVDSVPAKDSQNTNITPPKEEQTVLQQDESRSNSVADSIGKTFGPEKVEYNRSSFSEAFTPVSENQYRIDARENESLSTDQVTEIAQDSRASASEHISSTPVSFVEQSAESVPQPSPSDERRTLNEPEAAAESPPSVSAFVSPMVGQEQQEPEKSSPSYPRDDLSDRMSYDASDSEGKSFEQNTAETQSDFAQVSAVSSPEASAESTVLQDVPDESNRSVDSPTSVQSSEDVNQPPSDSGPKLSETVTELQNPLTPDKPLTDGQFAAEDRSIQPSEFIDSSLPAQPHKSDAPSLQNNGLPQAPRSESESPVSNQSESLTNTPDDLNGRVFDTTNSSQLNREKYNPSVSDSAAIADSPRSPNPLPSNDGQGPNQNGMLQNNAATNAATNALSSRSSPQVAAPENWSSLEDLLSFGQNTLTQGSNNTVGNLMQAGNTLAAQALIDRPPMDSPEDFFKDIQGYSTTERGNVPLPEAWETLSDLINNIKLPGTEAQESEIEDVTEPPEEDQATVEQIEFADKVQIQPATVEAVNPKELQVLRQNLYERIQNQFEIERERQGNAFKNPPSFDLYSIDSTPEFNPTFLTEERLPTALSAYFYEVVQANEGPLSTGDTWEIYQQMRYECELERERQGIYFWENRSSSSDTGF